MGTIQTEIAPNGQYSECEIISNDYWRLRIDAILEQWLRSHTGLPIQKLEMLKAPPPHRGLGSGTQMACTVAATLQAAEIFRTQATLSQSDQLSMKGLFAEETWPIAKLRELSQRGKRSNIGLRGFLEGGFILDYGLAENGVDQGSPNSRTQRFEFPHWPVLILQDNESSGDFGKAECKMFEDCSKSPNPNRASMLQIVKQELIPAMEANDWQRFDKALGQYGRWAGQIFAPSQGGIYRTPKIEEAVEIAKRLGIEGATQSSWGPTVCIFARDEEHAKWCSQKLIAQLPKWNIATTGAANSSAQVNMI